MPLNNLKTTTVGDLIVQALKECRWIGVGQVPQAEDLNDGMFRLLVMLQEWEAQRWYVYHLVNYLKVSTGVISYSLGPGGDFDTGVGSERPAKVEGGFLRQNQANPNQVDFPLTLLQSMEDYNRIRLKGLVSFPQYLYYDPSYPLGTVYFWPVPQASIYSVDILVREQLPASFTNQAQLITLPTEYYSCMLYNLALRLRNYKGLPAPQGDMLPVLARNASKVLISSHVQIAELKMPTELMRPGRYNIFSDQSY